jgi:hypothetical protein
LFETGRRPKAAYALPLQGRAIACGGSLHAREKAPRKKIQAIYRALGAPNTGKVIEIAKERPMEKTGQKTGRRTMETGRNTGACSRIARSCRHPQKTIARRREAPGAHIQD